MKVILIFFLLSVGVLGHAQNCYDDTRKKGMLLLNQGHYTEAIDQFEAAKDCPDKPSPNDLDAKIQECKRKEQEIDRKEKERQNKERENELARKGYVNIKNMTFANVDSTNKIINGYGVSLYASDIKYLRPKLTYDGLLSSIKTITLYKKMIDPDGALLTGTSSPSGYTSSENVTINSGTNNVLDLRGWGNQQSGTYVSGTYRYELWYGGYKIYEQSFTLHRKTGEASYLKVDDKTCVTCNFAGNGDKKTFSVSTDASSWTTWGIPSWCSVENKTSTSFTLKCDVNDTSSERKDYMEIRSGSKSVRINITQTSYSNALLQGQWRTLMRKAIDYVTSKYDKDVYKGEYSNGKRSGLGVYCWESGVYYWGRWSLGDQNGYAIYIVPEEWQVGNCSDCMFYVGNWSSGYKSGKGTCYDKYGNLIYYGNFSNNSPTGAYPSTGNYSIYKFRCIEFDGGNKYIGETKNGLRDGYGIFLWKNGDAWYGPWKEGNRNGYGIYFSYKGEITTGKWVGDTYSAN